MSSKENGEKRTGFSPFLSGVYPILKMFRLVLEYRKFPPEFSTVTAAGTFVTFSTAETDCDSVSPSVVKVWCAAAPFTGVPFRVSCKTFVCGRLAPLMEDAEPLYDTKYTPVCPMVKSEVFAVCVTAVPLTVPFWSKTSAEPSVTGAAGVE